MVVLAFSHACSIIIFTAIVTSTIRTKKYICVEFGPGSYVVNYGFLLMVTSMAGTCTWKTLTL